MSPILWAVTINKILEIEVEGVNLVMYFDDLTIIADDAKCANLALKKITKLLQKYGLYLAINKTSYIKYGKVCSKNEKI